MRGKLCDIDGLGAKMQQKDDDIMELKRALKMKANELSEYGVKISVLEQKLAHSFKEVSSSWLIVF